VIKPKLQIKERGNSPNCDYEAALLHKNWRMKFEEVNIGD